MKSRTLWMAGISLALAVAGRAQQPLAEYNWQQVAAGGRALPGAVVESDGRTALRVSNTNDTPLSAQLLEIRKPPVKKSLYALMGEVKYEQVKGDGYLELWNYFPPAKPGMPEGAYFSRTLGDSGDLGKLTGTSHWRRFVLPFDRTGSSEPPARLRFNLFLPGKGTVYFGAVQLVEFNGSLAEMAPAQPGAWWSSDAGAWGGVCAVAALAGLAAWLSWLASRGKSRAMVVAASLALTALGAAAVVVGLLALALRQPPAVWIPLLLPGVLVVAILPLCLRHFRKHYEDAELRRMVSLDASGG